MTDPLLPARVLLTIDDYQRLTGTVASIVGLLATAKAMPQAGEIEFEPDRARNICRPSDLA